jgi:hypothetical protein
MSRTEASGRIKGELAEGPSPADQSKRVIGVLAVGVSIILGLIVGFLTHEFVVALVFAVVAFAVVALRAGSRGTMITEKCSPKEAEVTGETPEQQSNLRDDDTNPTERQTTPEVSAVRTEPEEPEEALAECEVNTALSREGSTPTMMGYPTLCGRCGQPLRDGVKFCQKCGAKVGGYAPESEASTEKGRLCSNCGCAVTGSSKTCEWCGTEEA